MDDKIKCPCCGGNSRVVMHDNGDNFSCFDCLAIWKESRRQPSQITPEAAYNWFCDRILENSKEDVVCLNLLGGEGLWADDATGGCWVILTKNDVKALGWKDMPERRRTDES